MRVAVRGRFYYLYLVVNVWSRTIVGWSIHEREDNALAAVLIRQAAYTEQAEQGRLIPHSDNGAPMKERRQDARYATVSGRLSLVTLWG